MDTRTRSNITDHSYATHTTVDSAPAPLNTLDNPNTPNMPTNAASTLPLSATFSTTMLQHRRPRIATSLQAGRLQERAQRLAALQPLQNTAERTGWVHTLASALALAPPIAIPVKVTVKGKACRARRRAASGTTQVLTRTFSRARTGTAARNRRGHL